MAAQSLHVLVVDLVDVVHAEGAHLSARPGASTAAKPTRRPAAYRMPELQSLIGFGASPRATIALAQAARAHAFIEGRGYATPDDIKAVAHDVLRHRIVTTYEAEAEELTTDDLIDRVLEGVDIP